jgi:MFS family permease
MSRSLAVSGPRGIREIWLSGFAVLCLGQFLGHQTALTFSLLIPVFSHDWRLSGGQAGAILGAFQFGQLIAYALVGFLLDQMRSRPVMVWSAALVGLGDLLFATVARNFASGFALRLLEGFLVGGLYVPALKYIADSVPQDRRGRVTGVFIAVLVAAYAAPLLYGGVLAPRVGWRLTMATVGALELAASAVLATFLPDVPLRAARAGTGVAQYLRDVLRNRPARRVILAYTAHNWELFGMWGWLTPFMVAALAAHGRPPVSALAGGGALAAAVIGVGGSLGAIAGGRLSDHIGRARAASLMLAVSLLCSLGYGWLLKAPITLLAAVGLLYGTTSLADSPSYSASLMEVVPARSLGGAFSIQMLFGWSATVMAPPAFGMVLDFVRGAHGGPAVPWAAAFGILAIGPAIGLIALAPMRRRQRVHAADSAEIAGKARTPADPQEETPPAG